MNAKQTIVNPFSRPGDTGKIMKNIFIYENFVYQETG